jgi:predicted AAA+ superfamily ATPase
VDIGLSFRDSASFGKRQEFIVISELLRRGYDVYQTLVDDQQIDCIVRKGKQNPVYVDIQIKARSNRCSPKDAARFAGMVVESPRPNYFFIFHSEQLKKTCNSVFGHRQ